MKGYYKVETKEDAKPFALTAPRRVAIPLLPKVKVELQRMEQMGVITRVEEPTDWCAGIVVVPKPNGKVRICVDLTKLNESVKRERQLNPSISCSDIGTNRLSQTLHQIRCQLRILESGTPSRFPQANHLHHSLWEVLFQPSAIWLHLRSRTFSKTYE